MWDVPSVPGPSGPVISKPVTRVKMHVAKRNQFDPSEVLHTAPVIILTTVFRGKLPSPVHSKECDDRPGVMRYARLHMTRSGG